MPRACMTLRNRAVQLVGLNVAAWAERSSLDAKQSAMRQVLQQGFPQVALVLDAPPETLRSWDWPLGHATLWPARPGGPSPVMIENAIQAAGREVRLKVHLYCRGQSLRLCISDNGPGIKPEHFPHIFDSFFTTKSTGMGMGLLICRSIIEALGGTIEAKNNENSAGACFVLLLPLN